MVAARTLRDSDFEQAVPIYVVWEITLRCDHACAHCGSRAGPAAREDELDTDELLEVADALVALGSREVTLIGGEAYLRSDVYRLVEHMAKAGLRVTMQTGGRGLTAARARRFRDAGMKALGVSVDGPREIHDQLRAAPGSFDAAMAALDNARDAGLIITSNSQINRLNRPYLQETASALKERGVYVWRSQLTAPMGRAADHPEWILQPWMILDVLETLEAIQIEAIHEAEAAGTPPERAFNVALGNNLGYYGPHERILRPRPNGPDRHWGGCPSGKWVIGIESDGTVKGCPSLPTAPYVGGNVRDLSLAEIWAEGEGDTMTFARTPRDDELWGYCRDCYYAQTCQAGCSFTAHSTLGRRGNYPFCWHRANDLKKQGKREHLVHATVAPGAPYDFGRFELRVEPWQDDLLAGDETAPPDPGRRSLPVVS